jgi:hypothetical protein
MTHPLEATRRRFLRRAAFTAGALAGPLVLPSSVLARDDKPAPSERITGAVLGTGNMGFHDIRGFLGDPRAQDRGRL